jgi:hypothetical protein
MSSWSRWSSGALLLAISLLLTAQAEARSRVLLLTFSGRKADVLRDKVVQSLEQGGYSVELSETSSGISKAQIGRLGRSSGVDAVVEGDVRRRGVKLWTVVLRVHDPRTGRRLGSDIRFKNSWLPGLATDLLEQTSERVDSALKHTKGGGRASPDSLASPQEESAADAPEANNAAPSAPEEPLTPPAEAGEAADADQGGDLENPELDRGADGSGHKGSGMVAEVRARGGVVHRTFSFSDDLYDRLRKQGTNTWVYQVEAELYPFDHPVGDHLGIIASYEGTISGSVKDNDFGGNFPVIFREFYAGVRARYPLASHQIGFDLTFGQMHSSLDDPQHRAGIPGVDYTLLRSSLDGDFALGPIHALASLGFRLPLGFGEVSDAQWFPHVGGYGVEASAGLNYPLSKHFALELTGSLRRYLLEMNSVPQDAVGGVAEVAGGAVDRYESAYFGMTIKL